MKPVQEKPVELVAYAATATVSAFAASIVSEREHEYAEAKSAVSAYTNALDKMKKSGQPTVQDPTNPKHGKMVSRLVIEEGLHRAIDRQRAAKASVESGVRELTRAREAQQEAHANLIQGRIRIVTQCKKSVEVIIRVGGQSVTRHLQVTSDGYAGQAWDRSMLMIYPRDLESKVTTFETPEVMAVKHQEIQEQHLAEVIASKSLLDNAA